MTRQELAQFVRLDQSGQIFSVEFVKRTNGELRHMVCRKGVTKHLKGGPAAYNFSEKGLVSVFDMQKGAYRCIPLESIKRVKMHGEEWIAVE